MQHEAKTNVMAMMKRTGHVLAVEDFDDLAELDKLAAEVTDPQTGIDSPLTNHAVFFRGLPVYPLTLAHLSYLDSAPLNMGLSPEDRTVLMLWILTLPQIEDAHYDGPPNRKTMRKWAGRCPWTEADMDAILSLRYGRIAENAKRAAHTTADPIKEANRDGALIGMLSREYGESPEYWMHKAPIGVIESCVADWNRNQEAQAAAYRKASAGSGKAVAPPASPKFDAMRRLREAAERIEAKWHANAA